LTRGIFRDVSDRKQTEWALEQQVKREKLLREISQRIRESLDLQTIFETACDEIRQMLEVDRVAIFQFYPDSHYDDGEFVAESGGDGIPSVRAVKVHDHCFGDNYANRYAQGRHYIVDDIYSHNLSPCHRQILAQFQVRANLVMPLLCGEALWGLLCIHQCHGPHQWSPSVVDLAHQTSNQLAIAIQQASLYQQVQTELTVRQQAETRIAQQLRQQESLGRIIQQVRESLDFDNILQTVTQQVQAVFGADRVIVFRLFADGRSCILEETVTDDLPRLRDRAWDDEVWSQDILDWYWQGQPRIVPDVMADRWTDCLVDYSREGKIQSKMVAPILQELCQGETHRWVAPTENNKLWGVLVVHACQTQRVWQPEEAQLLQQIANQLGIAIQQSGLFAQLRQSNQDLAEATHMKDEFLANMSHELRTPLNAILGMTEALQDEVFGSVNDQQRRSLETVERSSTHLLSLINDILDVAKIESGTITLEPSAVSVKNLCQSSLAFVNHQALKKQLHLTTQL
jgi:GAF domain-containing protein